MKKKLFLVAALCLFLTCQAFAKTGSIDSNYGNGWKTFSDTDSSVNESEVVEWKHISSVEGKSINTSLNSNTDTAAAIASNDHRINGSGSTDKVKSNISLSVDLSESSSVVLVGIGVVIAIIRKWRKLLNSPNESELLKNSEAI